MALLLALQLTREALIERLEAPPSIAFAFETWIDNEFASGRVAGRVRLVRGEFLEIESTSTLASGGEIFVAEVYEPRRYAARFGSTVKVAPSEYATRRDGYPLRERLLPSFVPAGYGLLPALLYPAAFVASLDDLRIRDGFAVLDAAFLDHGKRFPIHFRVRRGRVDAMLMSGDREATTATIEAWTDVGGVELPARIRTVWASGSRMQSEQILRTTYSDVRHDPDRARPAWLDDDSIATLEERLTSGGDMPSDRRVTSPWIDRLTATAALRAGDAVEWMEPAPDDPLFVRMQAARLTPREFVEWFSSTARTPEAALLAIRDLAESPAPNAAPFRLDEPPPPLDPTYFDGLGELPPALRVTRARLGGDPQVYVELLDDPDWRRALGAEPAAVAKAGADSVRRKLLEIGTVDMELLKQAKSVEAVEATIRRIEAEPRLRGELRISSGVDPNEHLGKILDSLPRPTARRLFEAAETPAWGGHPVSMDHDAEEIYGDKSIEFYRWSRGGYEGGHFTEVEVLDMLSAQLEAGTIRASDFEAVQTWMTKGDEPARWRALIDRAADRLGDGAEFHELRGDGSMRAGEYADGLDRYAEAYALQARADPFEPRAIRLGSVDEYIAGLPDERGIPLLHANDPLPLKIAHAARLADRRDRGIELIDGARIAPDELAVAFEMLGDLDRAIAARKRRLRDASESFRADDAARELCGTLKKAERWGDVMLGIELWRRFAADDRYALKQVDEMEAEAAGKLEPDHFIHRFIKESGPSPDPARVEALVSKLSAESIEERDAALRELEATGPTCAAALGKHLEAKDPEVRTRVRALLTGWSMDYFRKRFLND